MNRAASRAALLLLGSAAGMGSGELLLRVARPGGFEGAPNAAWPWVVTDPVLGIKNREGFAAGEVAIDAWGLRRAPGAASLDRRGTPRVLCMGDSRTFGVWRHASGQRLDADYPRLLEERLAPRMAGVEVLNAGVIGHSSSHGLRLHAARLHRLEPDVLVVAHGVNDHLAAWAPELRAGGFRGTPGRRLVGLAAPSRVFQLLLATWQRAGPHPAPLAVPWATLDVYEANLRAFAEVSRARRYLLVFLWIPLRPVAWSEDPPVAPENVHFFGAPDVPSLYRLNESYRATMERVALEEEVSFVQMPLQREAFGPDDFVHPTPAGAAIVAELLARVIVGPQGPDDRPADAYTSGDP